MALVALTFGLVIAILGAIGVVAPTVLPIVGRLFLNPARLYLAAVLRLLGRPRRTSPRAAPGTRPNSGQLRDEELEHFLVQATGVSPAETLDEAPAEP
ncbi:MAG TPA: hypothetical protein VGK30_13995 [Candidatus Binatia bacterium]